LSGGGSCGWARMGLARGRTQGMLSAVYPPGFGPDSGNSLSARP